MLALVSRRERRRRLFVAALFALARDGATVSEPTRATVQDGVDADELVARLFRLEAPSLVRMARLFTDDRNAAEDLVQEAFIRLHRSAGTIRDLDKAAPYLRSIVLNLARDHNRRGLMSLRHRSALKLEVDDASLEDVIVAKGEHQQVVDALRELAPRQRDCLVLRFFYDLSEREIAETLGISPNSVKTHFRRGMAALGEKLEEPT